MKKSIVISVVIMFLYSTSNAQQSSPDIKDIKQTVKKGWIFGPLPAIGYTSDQGFQYGIMTDLFYFGDGTKYPQYIHKFNFEISKYTKGSGVYHMFYDSKYLLGKIRTTFDLSYLTDRMLDFYGFNGYATNYDSNMANWYYKIDRTLFRITADFQGKLAKNFGWALGVGYYDYNIKKADRPISASNTSLYEVLQSYWVINPSEANGGRIYEFKAGIVHDTRNFEPDPTKGFYTEAIVTTAPRTGFSNRGYSRISFIHRGYLPVIGEKLTFAYRLGYQDKISGHIPFYALQNLTTLFYRQITSEGLGGINSIRGVLRNRVVGDGIFWSNFELRYRFCNFNFLGQDWYLVTNPFIDAGRVINYYKEPVAVMTLLPLPEYYDELKDSIHWSAGIGFKAIMNKNFVISFEFGKPFNRQDGTNGMNIGLNYIF